MKIMKMFTLLCRVNYSHCNAWLFEALMMKMMKMTTLLCRGRSRCDPDPLSQRPGRFHSQRLLIMKNTLFWSGHVSSSFQSNVSKVTSILITLIKCVKGHKSPVGSSLSKVGVKNVNLSWCGRWL